MRFSRGPKYGNERRTPCRQKHIHDSKLEADYCNQLELLTRAGEIRQYNVQYSFPLIVEGILIAKHIVDFVVINNEGGREVHETKGYATKDWKLKRKLFNVLYPLYTYHVISSKKRRLPCVPKRILKNKSLLKKIK